MVFEPSPFSRTPEIVFISAILFFERLENIFLDIQCLHKGGIQANIVKYFHLLHAELHKWRIGDPCVELIWPQILHEQEQRDEEFHVEFEKGKK